MSTVTNLAPLWASNITPFRKIFVFNRDTAGDFGSPSYSNLSPPTVIRTWCVSAFKSLKSHKRLSYVTFASRGTLCLGIKKIVFVPLTYFSSFQFLHTPCASCQNLFDNDCVHILLSFPCSNLSILFLFLCVDGTHDCWCDVGTFNCSFLL